MSVPNSPLDSQPWRVAVVGGGLTGLAAAHRVIELCAAEGRPLELVLFDAADRCGGVIGTREIAGYRVELGADSFITNKPAGVELCKRLGLEERLVSTDARYRRSLVLRKGRPVEVPEGFQLLSPVKVWPVLSSPIFSWAGKLRMGCEYFLPARKSDADESLADFVRRRFGREALERLVQPLVGGIYTSDPETLSLRATMPRFLEMERRHGSLIRALRAKSRDAEREASSGARYGLFTTLRNGMSELLDTLAQRVREGGDVRVGTRIVQLARAQGGWRVTTDAGDASEFDAVILAVPAYRAADLVAPFADDLASQLRQIEYASSAIVVSGHKLADVQHPLDAFGLVIPAIERRKILAVSFTSRKFSDRAPDGCVQLRTFVGGAMQPEMFELSDEEILQIVRGELRELLGVGGEPDFEIVARYPRAMPQYHVGHLERVAAFEAMAARFSGLALAGNAYHGVGVPDCVQSAETAAQRLYVGQAAAMPQQRVVG